MEVRYRMTIRDYEQFFLYCFLHRPPVPMAFGLLLCAGLVLTAVVFHLGIGRVFGLDWQWALAVGALVQAVVGWRTYHGIASIVSKQPGALGEALIRITPAEIEQRTAVGDGKVLWFAIKDIRSSPHAIYMFFGIVEATIVPRRAFAVPAEADAFLQLARSYWDDARRRAAGLATAVPDDSSSISRG